MSVTYGYRTYGTVLENFEPIVEIGNYGSIAGGVQCWGHAHHLNVRYPKSVSQWPFPVFEPFKSAVNCDPDTCSQTPEEQEFYCNAYDAYRSEDPTIRIGHDVWLGSEALILDGVTIGNGAVIGARAIVTKDVPAYGVCVGNPGVVKKIRFSPEQVEALERIQWWYWDDAKIISALRDMKDIDVFIEKYG